MQNHGGSLDKNILDFSANISPLGMHPSAIETLHKIALNPSLSSIYPDSDCAELKKELSKFWNFDSENIVCGSGADDLIYLISNVFGMNSVLIFEPSFSEYEKSLSNSNCEILHFDFDESYAIEEKLNAFSDKNISLLFAASPSNPLGQLLSFYKIEKIQKFCQKKNAVFVLDACFCQFSKNAENIVKKIIAQKENFKNLIILNAFTKFYGMAGLRLGYALCFSSKIAQKLNQNLRSWTVSSVAQLCGISVIQSELSVISSLAEKSAFTWSKQIQNLVETEKKRFYEFFDSHKIKYFKSEANFITFELNFDLFSSSLKIEKSGCVEILNDKIQIRSCSNFKNRKKDFFKNNYHRIAIKTTEENTELLNILENLYSNTHDFFQRKKSPKFATANLMIQGTMSNAGKSLLVAALCRIFKKDGFKVAPFKSQNMALNSGVTLDGKEMGRAQILQAQAAGILPDVRMNPILLKPNSDTGSQIIVNGIAKENMSAKDYFKFRKNLIPEILNAYNSLASENDIIVIEGAGSPAEINLKENDIVNMGLAELVDAPVLIAGDIDRGGVFASLYGTAALVTEKERSRIKGFLINKFRGDVKLLQNGLDMIKNLTNIPVLGVVPYLKNLKLDDEDSLSCKLKNENGEMKDKKLSIFIVNLPYISNFTDIDPLYNLEFVNVQYFSSVQEYDSLCKNFGKPDLMILPGTKNTINALEFLNKTQLSSIIIEFSKDNPVIGICGGYQLLGEILDDSEGNEDSSKQIMNGLGLLPLKTKFTNQKTLVQVSKKLPKIEGFYSALSEKTVTGYEIHSGKMKNERGKMKNENGKMKMEKVESDFLENRQLSIFNSQFSIYSSQFSISNFTLGTYIHGFFDNPEILRAILQILCDRKNIVLPDFEDYKSIQEKELDRLEKTVRESIDLEKIYEIIGIKK